MTVRGQIRCDLGCLSHLFIRLGARIQFALLCLATQLGGLDRVNVELSPAAELHRQDAYEDHYDDLDDGRYQSAVEHALFLVLGNR